jgi:hypothetical protein
VSSSSLTIQQPAFEALAAIFRSFPTLPSGTIQLSDVFSRRVSISLHDDLADFEAWREALDIAPDDVERIELPSQALVLRVEGQFAGIEVVLHGYAPLCEPAVPVPSAGQLAEQRHLLDTQDAAYSRCAPIGAPQGVLPV